MTTKRQLRVAIALAAIALVGCGGSGTTQSSQGASFPTKTVTILVAYSAGSNNDLVARLIASQLESQKHWTVVVKDEPGAGGALAVQSLRASQPDGYTLMLVDGSIPFLIDTPGSNLSASDFTPIAKVDSVPVALVVPSSSPYQTLPEFVAGAKAKPGSITIAGAGPVNQNTAVQYELSQEAGIRVTNVPYSGGAEVTSAVLGGHTDAALIAASNFQPSVAAGKLKYLAVSQVTGALEGAPTFAQYGYAIDVTNFAGIVGPPGLPQSVVSQLASGLKGVTQTKKWSDQMTALVSESDYLNAPDFSQFWKENISSSQSIVITLYNQSKGGG